MALRHAGLTKALLLPRAIRGTSMNFLIAASGHYTHVSHLRHGGSVLIENAFDSPAASIDCLEFQEMETSLSPLK